MKRKPQFQTTDREYIAGHRFMYGGLGEYVARAAILMRDTVLRPIVLPVIRLAPVAPYGHCMGLSGNSASLAHARQLSHGIWLYLHPKWYGGDGQPEIVDEVVLHELLHNELMQFGLDPKHKSDPWAGRCQEISRQLGLSVRIERPRSVRVKDASGKSRVTTGTPTGCLPYAELAKWPWSVLNGGPSLRARLGA